MEKLDRAEDAKFEVESVTETELAMSVRAEVKLETAEEPVLFDETENTEIEVINVREMNVWHHGEVEFDRRLGRLKLLVNPGVEGYLKDMDPWPPPLVRENCQF